MWTEFCHSTIAVYFIAQCSKQVVQYPALSMPSILFSRHFYRGFGLENQVITAKSTALFVHVMLDLTKPEPLRSTIWIFKQQRLQFEKLSIYMHIHKPIILAAEERGNDTRNSFCLTFLCRPKVAWKSLFVSQEFCRT